MKKLFLSLVALFAVVLLANAQPPRGQGGGERLSCEDMTKQRIESLDESLDLTDEQKDEVTAIFAELCADESGDMRSAMQKADEKIKAILDDSQKEAYDKMEKGPQRGGSRG